MPELRLARNQGQGPFHHLDTFGHILETVRGVERELTEGWIGARVDEERRRGLRVVGLLHDVAKPVTRGEAEGRVLFVAHDTLGARMAQRVCRRLGLPARLTDLAATLTALHLKIGFMGNPRSDYAPERLARAAGPFGEELAVLSWADRLAAQGPRLKPEHVERHRELCVDFLRISRDLGPYPEPDYEGLAGRLSHPPAADVGYAASRVRLLTARGLAEDAAVRQVVGLSGRGEA
ncbi:MAG: tRNA nucleotidyltransferase, A-adding [uncultured Rubrobacteraceae bacterium]|uniref:tRNA nucleotidyltransferase, A-adding n=1 Tax=uncultured Rubrobacteraceae bacterium TaxID=349277 RepID=A0A6N3ITZ0_9ACTN|nr:MAG: tRNA nucleotidyltransferase, A-adding [uncultured Rubrobacteraceae bacterium]